MKRFILFLLLIFILPVKAAIITGEVEYDYNAGYSYNTAKPVIKYIDSANIENRNYLLQGITELKDRKLAKFSDGSYGVLYYDDPMYTWYYSENGHLINYTRKDSDGYPCRITKYKPDGSIANTGYRVSESESFIYSPQGKLIAHWIGENCYDGSNNLIMKRKFLK